VLRGVVAVTLGVLFTGAVALGGNGVLGHAAAAVADPSPIQHVVFIDEENHSFNDILGKYCVEQSQGLIVRDGPNDGCIGSTTATLHDGSTYPLTREADAGVNINHGTGSQQTAIDGGQMDGFDLVLGCEATSSNPHACLAQFDPLNGSCGKKGTKDCLPNVDSYANHFALSDHTFEFRATPSWAGHMILGDASLEHFTGRNPLGGDSTGSGGPIGWGCDSQKYAEWNQDASIITIPPCIPDSNGSIDPWYAQQGYSGPLADHLPTIFDRMQETGISWKVYGGSNPTGDPTKPTNGGYGWTICPDFWSCLGDPAQHANLVKNGTILTDLTNGALPQVSFVTPNGGQSAHPPQSAHRGDHWVGKVVSAVMSSSSWASTAIFIAYDDCGCFYDPVNPFQYNPNWGIRVPMLIVSPFAKAGYTDTTPATFISVTAYIEHTFGITPLNPCAGETSFLPNCTDDVMDWDGGPTYDFSNAFDYGQAPLGQVPMIHTGLPSTERTWLGAHRTAGTDEAT
jgi:phospholipase C